MTTKVPVELLSINGGELVLDADGDTSITADTDDQIDFKVGGTDRLSLESDGKLKVTEIAHITSGNLEIGNGDEKQIFDATGQTIQFQTADTERVRIDSSGNVGIGTTAPTDYNASDKLTIANTSGNASLTIVAGTSGESSVFLADGTSGNASYRGYVQYQHANDNMNIGTGGTERLRIYGNDLFLNGGTDARIQLGSGGAGANTVSNDTVHIRGDGDSMKLMCANDGIFLFEHNGTERLRISASSGNYAALHITSDYGRFDIGALNTGYHHFMAQSGPS